ncbi:MAG: helix-turn-helix domain-containing protein [Candidatus Aenigmatarchaeota archaeon]
MRMGREFYVKNYDKVVELYESGLTISEIAEQMKISYSCVYHWVKGLRKPDIGKLNEFEDFLKEGPKPVTDVKEKFPKHNELYLVATRRGMPIKRHVLKRKFGDYSTWYYITGQETALKEQVSELFSKYKELKEKIVKAIG